MALPVINPDERSGADMPWVKAYHNSIPSIEGPENGGDTETRRIVKIMQDILQNEGAQGLKDAPYSTFSNPVSKAERDPEEKREKNIEDGVLIIENLCKRIFMEKNATPDHYLGEIPLNRFTRALSTHLVNWAGKYQTYINWRRFEISPKATSFCLKHLKLVQSFTTKES